MAGKSTCTNRMKSAIYALNGETVAVLNKFANLFDSF